MEKFTKEEILDVLNRKPYWAVSYCFDSNHFYDHEATEHGAVVFSEIENIDELMDELENESTH